MKGQLQIELYTILGSKSHVTGGHPVHITVLLMFPLLVPSKYEYCMFMNNEYSKQLLWKDSLQRLFLGIANSTIMILWCVILTGTTQFSIL